MTHTIVLTIASHETEGRDLGEYVAAVTQLSHGTIRLVPKESWRGPEIEYDRGTVADVRARKVDLAKIAVRSFDTLGARQFQPLMAPFLVDSLALEGRVLAAPLADRMLGGVSRLGVTALAALPGELRRPYGQRRAFLSPRDYRGAVFGIRPAKVSSATLRTLGAQPRAYSPGELPYSFAGAELDLATIEGNQYDVDGTSVTANVAFWPRTLVVIANRRVFETLTSEQRQILREAGRVALAPAITRLRREDRQETEILCRRHTLAFVRAAPSELDALRKAVRPVFAGLKRDAVTRAAVSAIVAMKKHVAPETGPRCGSPPARTQGTMTPLDGSWEMNATLAQAGAVDAGRYRLVLRRGRVSLSHVSPSPVWSGKGVFELRGDRVVFRFSDGTSAIYRWNVYRELLTLRYSRGHATGAPNPTFAPWHRVAR